MKMGRPSILTRRSLKELIKGFFFIIPTALSLITSILILVYVSSTSKLIINHTHLPLFHLKPSSGSSSINNNVTIPSVTNQVFQLSLHHEHQPQPAEEKEEEANTNINRNSFVTNFSRDDDPITRFNLEPKLIVNDGQLTEDGQRSARAIENASGEGSSKSLPVVTNGSQLSPMENENENDSSSSTTTSQLLESQELSNAQGNQMNTQDIFHDEENFHENYKEMNKTLKIYIYPHNRNHPFSNILLPVDHEPTGNYASESYFKKILSRSHFITKDPSQAHLFYLPFSIASLRHDKRIGVGGIQDFVKDYVGSISRESPYWNRSGGADHFYVACHSIGRSAMEKAVQVRINAIQVVCSSSYFVPGYIAHKDASVPQIWPRQGNAPNRVPSERKKLAFYAGALNSRVRENLVRTWENDSEISVHQNRLTTPYSESLLNSKFCIHAKGYEVNTARIGDALYYGCVPVILADHYDLPFADILNWNSFSVVVSTSDMPLLKNILKGIDFDEYLKLQGNVLKVRNHFQWHSLAVDYDCFYMVMYELWLRRSSVRIRSMMDQR